MPSLIGKTIAITEARRAREMAGHIAKLGGAPVVAPALREVPTEDPEALRAAVRRICAGEMQWAIFLTGVGARALMAAAEGMGCREAFLAGLNGMRVAARGPKPVAALREAGVRVDLAPEDPTSEGLALALRGHDLRGRAVALQLYGEPNPDLVAALERQGATVLEMRPYTWDLPADQGPLEALVLRLIAGQVDAVTFTSGPQVRHLFQVAARLDLVPELRQALAARVPVAAVGAVTERELTAHGVVPRIRSPKPTMGALILAVARALGGASSPPPAGSAGAEAHAGASMGQAPVGGPAVPAHEL
jgi:uroporphyrinogen-III synthase